MIKEKIKEVTDSFKKSSERKAELKEIKNKAYFEKMKEQSKWMGEEQARIDSEHRKNAYIERLKQVRDLKKLKSKETIPTYNWITGAKQ